MSDSSESDSAVSRDAADAADGSSVGAPAVTSSSNTAVPHLAVTGLTVRFPTSRRLGRKRYLTAVDDVSFDVIRGRTLGIVGESGSGKSTTALAVARLVDAQAGSARLDGDELLALSGEALRAARRRMQFIFQDPYSSLNPRLRAERIVREPIDNLGTGPRGSADDTEGVIDELFESVGLRPEQRKLFPHQFSGGQRQRLGIARALATRPELVICDEPVSALDVAVQSQILNLLARLQAELGLTYLFISHDLGVVQHVCDDVVVMYMGKVVERASRARLFTDPQHPYSQALLSAVPSVHRARGAAARERLLIPGDPPDPLALPAGCRFASRCPVALPACREEEPLLRQLADGQSVACHRAEPGEASPLRRFGKLAG